MTVTAPFKGTVGPNSQTDGQAKFRDQSESQFKREKQQVKKCAVRSLTQEPDKATENGETDGTSYTSEQCNKPIAVDRLKQIEALRQNVGRFITIAPPDRYAFIVLTVAKTIKERELSKRLEKLQRCALHGHVVDYVRVTEYQLRGAPHVHVVAITDKPGEYGIAALRKRLRKFARQSDLGSGTQGR
jgi:hypothetical protein